MNKTAAVFPVLSLSALRGAVGEVVGGADEMGCWDRVVSVWRIFLALDGLIAVLWAIVHRIRDGEALAGGECPAGAVVAASGPVRRRAVAGARAAVGRCVLTEVVASVGRVRRRAWVGGVRWWAEAHPTCWLAPVLAVRGRRFSEIVWGSSRNCGLIVPVR